VLGVDQRSVGRFRGVVPFSGSSFSACVLRGGDDLKIFVV
jgi:hypothetical protein